MNIKWLFAEFIGVFILTFIGAGSICLNEMMQGGIGFVGIALIHGLILALMILAMAPFSGGKLNPVVTLALWMGGKVGTRMAIMEVVFQVAGGITAALVLLSIFPEEVSRAVRLGSPTLGQNISFWMGVMVEAIVTFVLIFAVYALTIDPRCSFKSFAPFGVGLIVFISILVMGEVTGAAMNPARTFGPALISMDLTNQLVYWIGPVLGALVASVFYKRVILKNYAY